MTEAIGPATDRFLLAAVAIVVLAVTAPFLLSATVDAPAPGTVESSGAGPAGAEGGAAADDVSASEDGAEFVANGSASDGADDGDGDPADGEDATDVSVSIDASDTGGYLVPGREAVATVEADGEPVEGAALTVDGERLSATTARNGTLAFVVPGAEEFAVTAETADGATAERTLSPETDVTVEVRSVSRADDATIEAAVRGHDLRDADVLVDGTEAGATNESGLATVDVPAEAETLAVAVAYEDVRGSASVDLDLDVDVETFLPVAGSTVEATATYGDVPADVDVYVVSGDATDDADGVVSARSPDVASASGVANDWLPAASSATIVVTDGRTTETVLLEGLLRNLAIGVVLGLSLVGGTVLTSLRVLRWLEGTRLGRYDPTPLGALFLDLGAAIVGGAAALASVVGRLSIPRVGLPSAPRVRLPRLPDLAMPSLSLPSLSLPSLRLPDLALPSLSLSGLGWPGVPDLGRPSLGGSDEGDDGEAERRPVDPFADASTDDGVPELTHRELVRAAIRDLGRLAGVGRVETSTPGQIGRRAVDRALPADAVQAIVGTVREVEYGGDEPTAEDASRVRRAVRRLRDSLEDGGESA